jgi:CelD/BcsL family acetyltransferase involved in cellulose biosynthesis
MSSIRLTVAESVSQMDGLAPLWERILKVQPHTVFQRYTWNWLAAAVFRDRFTPMVVAAESDAGAAIIPASVNHATGQLELLGETLFDYRDVLHMGDPQVLRAAWQRLGETGKSLSSTIVETRTAQERWPEFSARPFANAPEVRQDRATEEQFRSHHSRLGRQLRRIGKHGVGVQLHTGDNCVLLRQLFDCKCAQFACEPNNIFADRKRCEFMVAVAGVVGKSCEVFTLETEQESLVAGLLTFRDGDYRRFYTIYYDPAWASYSPGILLMYEVTARSLGEGLNCDYLTGEYPYKLRFANSSRALCKIEASATELAMMASDAVSSAA